MNDRLASSSNKVAAYQGENLMPIRGKMLTVVTSLTIQMVSYMIPANGNSCGHGHKRTCLRPPIQ